jgi:hypothetical protein
MWMHLLSLYEFHQIQSSFADVVNGNLHNEQEMLVMSWTIEIRFNHWMRSNIESLETIKKKMGTICLLKFDLKF